MTRTDHSTHRRGRVSLPAPTNSFVGRTSELDRVDAMFDGDALFLIYGIAGIGKTEFAYRFIDRAQRRAPWAGATPIVYTVPAQTREEDFVAALRVASGVGHPRRFARRRPLDPREDLDAVVNAWNERPFIVLLDDLHGMDAAVSARLLGHLVRHVRTSRIVVTSRVEIPLDLAAGAPVVTRLAPLDVATSTLLAIELASRLGVCVDDVSEVVRRSGGSPFYLQHELAALVAPDHKRNDVLGASLRALDEGSRQLLLRLAMAGSAVTVDELLFAASPGENPSRMIQALSQRFLVDRSRGGVSVHPLIREVLLRVSLPTDISAARRAAAALHMRRFQQGGVPAAIDAVHAVSLLASAGAAHEALAVAQHAYRGVSTAGVDHLLLPSLEVARAEIGPTAHEVDLLMARTYARRSLIDEAREALRRAGTDPALKRSRRYLMVAGSVRQRLGDLASAERYFLRAELASTDEPSRLRAAFQVADLQSLRGQGRAARATLDRFSPALSEERTRCEQLRWVWSYTLSLALEHRFGEALVALHQIERQGESFRNDDARTAVDMLGVLIRAELDDVSGARERIGALTAHLGTGLHQHIGNTYRGVVAWCAGDLSAARALLGEAHRYFAAHEDEIWRAIAGYYLGRALLASGFPERAVEALEDALQTAQLRGLDGLLPVGRVALARAHISLGDIIKARVLAEPLLADETVTGRTRARALCMRAGLAAAVQDLPAMRRDLQEALRLGDEDLPSRYETLLDLADMEILAGGATDAVISAAAGAADYYRATGRSYMEARACMALAMGYASLKGEHHAVRAHAALEIVDRAIAAQGLEHLAARAAVVHRLLSTTTDSSSSSTPLMAAIATAAPRSKQAARSLRFLRVIGGPALAIGNRDVSQSATVERRHDLSVNLDSSTVATRREERRCGPITVAILSKLIKARGEIVDPESLFHAAWNLPLYHPLRHRNALYVAISRLRRLLRDLLDRDVIETQPTGWRLIRELDACVVDLPSRE